MRPTESQDHPGGEIALRRLTPARELTRPQVVTAIRAVVGRRELRSLSIALVDEPTLTALHARYFGDPTPTDVITFDLSEDPALLEGEIVVSVDRARSEATARRIPVKQELLRYIIHGALHLTGYDDRTAAARRQMRREEDRVLAHLTPERSPRRKVSRRR